MLKRLEGDAKIYLPVGLPGILCRHGKPRSPETDIATLPEMRRATQIYYQHAGPFGGPHTQYVRMSVRQ
jgi:hypothetical protein